MPEIHAGKKSKCKKCDAIIIIPKAPVVQLTSNALSLKSTTSDTSKSKADQIESLKHSNANNSSNQDSQDLNSNNKNSKVKESKEKTKECPACAELVSVKAISCKYCGQILKKNRALMYQPVDVSKVVILNILTLGIYHLFFLHRVFCEINRRGYTKISAGKSIGFFFIPFVNLAWVFIVWKEVGDFFEKEFSRARKKPPSVTLIKTWPIFFFISTLTCGLGSPFLIIFETIAFARTQRYLNNLPIISSEQFEKIKVQNKRPKPSGKAELSFILACSSIFLSFITAIPAIILAHLALKEIKNGDTIQNRKKVIVGLYISYFIILLSSLVAFNLYLKDSKERDLILRRELNKSQLISLKNLADLYETSNKKPIQSIEDILKLKQANINTITSPLSKIPYSYFPKRNVSEKNYKKWATNGKILFYEEIPDSGGLRMYLPVRGYPVTLLPEDSFQKLFNDEIQKYR